MNIIGGPYLITSPRKYQQINWDLTNTNKYKYHVDKYKNHVESLNLTVPYQLKICEWQGYKNRNESSPWSLKPSSQPKKILQIPLFWMLHLNALLEISTPNAITIISFLCYLKGLLRWLSNLQEMQVQSLGWQDPLEKTVF